MSRLAKKISVFLSEARIAINNGRQQTEIAAALALYGYDAARMAAGAALLASAEALDAARVEAFGRQLAATEAVKMAQQAVHQRFIVHRQLARLAFRADPTLSDHLGLSQRVEQRRRGWVRQVGQFYDKLLADEAIMAALGVYNVTAEGIAAAQAAVRQVALLDDAQDRQRAEAQQATRERDAAFEALQRWLVDYLAVARIALVVQPQLLEALGIVVKRD